MGEAMDVDEAPGGPAAGPEARHSIWPSIHPKLLELIRAHRSTLIFVNSRRLAERLAARLNELAEEELVRAHHGSVAREQRLQIEEDLKQGRLPALVATSSLELGIDMGAIDLVVQIEAPPSVASGMQRIGRAGHSVGEPSVGKIFPKYRGDLVEAAVVVERMRRRPIEETRIPRNPLDVLAQQLVAICAFDRWTVDALASARDRRRAASATCRASSWRACSTCSPAAIRPTSSPISSRAWSGTARPMRSSARNDARVVAITSGGTIPDRGLFGVFLPGDDAGRGGRRVGELDEEMVYESRVGETFLLGASTWRIEEIRPDRVIVTPAPGEPGKMPFWHGDAVGRPIELGRAIGAFLRELEPMKPDAAVDAAARRPRPRRPGGAQPGRVPGRAARGDRRAADRSHHRRRAVPRRARRLAGRAAHAVRRPRRTRRGRWRSRRACASTTAVDVQTIWSDDGIAVRLPEGVETRRRHDRVGAPARPGRDRGPAHGRAGRLGAVRGALPRERRARAAPAAPATGPAHAAVDAAPAVGRPAGRGKPVRLVPDHPRDLPRGPARRLRHACAASSCSPRSERGASGSSASSRDRPRRSPAHCCSTTSARSCTRATRRSPSGEPRRWRSTASCLPSCSAARSCAS